MIQRPFFRGLGLLVPACLIVLALGIVHPESAHAESTVQMRDLAFSPPFATVNQGDTVLWANTEDFMPHNIASGLIGREDAGQMFESPFIMPGDGFSYTFAEPGEYSYYCPLHPAMIGVIVVTPAS